jgi:coiled-coil and C2 domain-containing protein 2A
MNITMRKKPSVYFYLSRPPDNDFDASSLQRCRDILYINIFDEFDVDLPMTDRERGQIVRKRIARNWLGSIKVPFSNIYINGRVSTDIIFRIKLNPFLLVGR